MAEQIQRELAEAIVRDVNDPRFRHVTLSGVDVSPDLRHAQVHVTVAAGVDAGETVAALNRAAGFLRRSLGERAEMRTLPRLRFAFDPTLDRAERLDALIDAAVAEDEHARSRRAGERGDPPGPSGAGGPGRARGGGR